MSNSAHDDIRLTIEEQHIHLYRQRLDACPVGRQGDATALLQLIADLGRAADSGEASAQVRTLKLDHISEPLWLKFDVQVLLQAGWLDVLPHKDWPYLDEDQYRALYNALDESDFELEFRRSEPAHMSFSDLLDALDHLRIGRPSTLGTTLQEMEDVGMLVLDGDEVRLGTTAYQVLQVMQQRYPGVASKHFSTRLALLQNGLEQGTVSVSGALAQMLPDLLRRDDAALLAEQVWDDIETLYDPLEGTSQAPLQGLIQRSERSGS